VSAEPKLYKFLRPDGRTPQGYGQWPLPQGDQPGEWLPKLTGKLIACQHAYHVMRIRDLMEWATDDVQLYVVETRYKTTDDSNKVLARQARALYRVEAWNERNLRHFACDCAERVLPLFEQGYPNDTRPRVAITTARRFADGLATSKELAAARAAAWAAAGDAARAAAWAAAGDAAGDAAWAAGWAAARAAAWAAARAAAWDAAWDDAWDDAGDAARAAAWDAARAAETSWQIERLTAYLDGTHEVVKVQS
jgi:hypothetical protein